MTTQQPSVDFSGNIPLYYDTYLGPLFFESFSRDTAERVRQLKAQHVLELACGTGQLTRQLAKALPAGGQLVASDISPAMLSYASEQLLDVPAISWDLVDAVHLPYEDNTFDCIVSQFGAMFYSDRPKAYAEAFRALKPGGKLLMLTWDELAENPVPLVAHQTFEAFFPIDTPGFFQIPWAYHQESEIRRELSMGGFEEMHCAPLEYSGYASTPQAIAKGLMEGSPAYTAIVERDAEMLGPIQAELSARMAEQFGKTDLDIPLRAKLFIAEKQA